MYIEDDGDLDAVLSAAPIPTPDFERIHDGRYVCVVITWHGPRNFSALCTALWTGPLAESAR